MADTTKRFQWKWVGITFAMYVVFYLIPLVAASGWFGDVAYPVRTIVIGSWMFGGIIVIAAVAGYFSPGVTIWEPAVAGALLADCWLLGLWFVVRPQGASFLRVIGPILTTTGIVFLLSLFGAWMGERIQKAKKVPVPEESPAQAQV